MADINTKALLCDRTEFPYSDEQLEKVLDREQTVRTQWQIDLTDHIEAAEKKTKQEKTTAGEQLHGSKYSETQPSRYLAVTYIPLVIEGVIAELNKLKLPNARAEKQNIELLAALPWLEFCPIAFANMVDSAIKQDNVATVIERIADACQREAKWQHYATHEEGLFNRIIEQQHKSGFNAEHITKVLTVAMDRKANGYYGDHVERPELRWQQWAKGEASFSRWLGQLYMNIICVQTGLFAQVNDEYHRDTTKRLVPTETFTQFISETTNRIGLSGGYYLPLPVPPRDWSTTQCGGFWTRIVGQKKLIKNWNKGYQSEMLNRSEELSRVVFPAVNAAQHTAWRINKPVLDVLEQLVANDIAVAGLPSMQHETPLPVCPKCGKFPDKDHVCFRDPEAKQKDKQRKELLKRKKKGENINIDALIPPNKNEYLRIWKAEASDIHRDNVALKSKRLNILYGLQAAHLIENDERFYYVYQLDFRGRMYPLGQLNPQGTDWQKGILQFADGVELGEHGAKWLAVHVANTYGIDKCSFEDRVKWVQEHEAMILACAEHPIDVLDWTQADEPFCFLAACMEWAGYKREGNSYKSHCAVALDGSCSGIQHYSALLRDEVGALATNVKRNTTLSGKADIYGEVAKATIGLLQADIADKEVGKWASFVLAHNMIDRSVVKRAVMTLPYGSKYQSASAYVSAELLPKIVEAGITDMKEKREVAKYVSQKVWEAIPYVVQAARTGMSYLQKLANLFIDIAMPITWETPTGFAVQQSYYSVEARRINIFTGGSIVLKNNIPIWTSGEERQRISIFSTDDKIINPTRQVSGIAPNFIHSLDASHLMFSVVEATKNNINAFALIHDSLGVHAGRTEEFSQIIRNCFHDLYAEHDPLQEITDHLLDQIQDTTLRNKAPKMPDKGNFNIDDIKEAIYLFA